MVAAGLILLTWLGAYRAARFRTAHWGEPFLLASLTLGVLTWAVTELQSLAGFLSPAGALASWVVLATVTQILAWVVARRASAEGGEPRPLRWSLPPTPAQQALLGGILIVVTATGIVAWKTPVMAWDALAYHLPRVFYWAQYASIEHFPAPNARLLFMGPWPAFAQLQLLLLTGSDRLAHLLQWTCMIGSIVVAIALSRPLGLQTRNLVLGGALVASIPMGVLQASSALTDYTVSFWLIALAYYSLTPYWKEEHDWRDPLAAGAALGLALLSKGTAIPIALPLVVVLIIGEIKKVGTVSMRRLVVVAALALFLNGPHAARNLAAFGHPLAPADHRGLVGNQSFAPGLVISNLLRHTLVHFGTWNSEHARPLLAFNNLVHQALGVADGDPRSSHKSQKLQIVWVRDESLSSNGLHVLLFLACGLWLLLHRRRLASRAGAAYSLAFWGGAFLFILLIKYQHSISRLQLPLFVLGSAWAAMVLDRWLSSWKPLLIGWLLLVAALPWVLYSEPRPLLGSRSVFHQSREELLKRTGKGHYEFATERFAQRVRDENHRVLGLINNGDSLEYYLWHELRKHCEVLPRVENVEPEEGGTPRLAAPGRLESPPGLIAWHKVPGPPITLTVMGRTYNRQTYWDWGPFAVYTQARPARESRQTPPQHGPN